MKEIIFFQCMVFDQYFDKKADCPSDWKVKLDCNITVIFYFIYILVTAVYIVST